MARQDFDFDVGVIGAGAAGLSFASGAARLGAKTLLVERRAMLGGDCLHFGCVPSKTLIKTAHVRHMLRSAAAYGLPAVELPPVDFGRVRARIQEVIAAIQPHDSVERFSALGVDVRFGQAVFVDPHTIALDGARISAGRWIMATGARPAVPDIPGLSETPFLTNETLFSMPALPASLIVLGGGAIAVELAQALCRLGCAVTVLQRSGRLLSREDADVAQLVQSSLERDGVAIHTGLRVQQVRPGGPGVTVRATDSAGQLLEISAEALLVALGRQPNVEGLGLEQAGVAFAHRGIPVDARMRTTQPHMYAIGDVTGAHQFTHAAGYEAGIALANAVIRLPRKADYRWLPRAAYTAPEFAALGKTERELQAEGIQYAVWKEPFADNDRSLAEGEGEGLVKLLLDRKERPLGVQIVGANAGDLLGEWAVVLGGRVRLSTLASVVHPYPTRAESAKRVAGTVMAPKLFQGLLPRVLRLLFGYRGGTA